MKKFFGYIEGYYGRLLSWDDRAQLLAALDRLSLNTYIYGPKEDPFHRLQWKLPYPKKWKDRFSQFVSDGNKKNILVIPSLSPGLSFNYSSDADYRLLLKKFMAFADCGAKTMALFMDDIPEILPRSSVRSFTSLGNAHAVLLHRLHIDVRKRYPGVSLWFCPTVYCDQFAKEPVRKNRYLLDLSAGMPRDITLFWTGPSVISKNIDRKNIAPVSGLFHGNIVIWDNLYANDYCPHRLFVGRYRGRSPDVLSVTKGICLNPTGLLKTDMALLERLSAFVNKKHSALAQGNTFNELSLPKEFNAVARFFNSPFQKVRLSDLSSRKCAAYKKALNHLIWNWKSPLQREWYPFLFMLDTDLKLLEKSEKKTLEPDWIGKKYPPVLSTMLVNALSSGKQGKK